MKTRGLLYEKVSYAGGNED